MQIPLDQFEQRIDETILKRGLSYFKKNQVEEFEEISTGEYQAIVTGTEDYTINLKVEKDVVTEWDCTCPYVDGPVCKHVAASIFYLVKDELELEVKAKKTANKSDVKKVKRKPVMEQIDELLDKTSHDELKTFIREQAKSTMSFRNLFLSSFAQHNSSESKEMYASQIKAILKSGTNRYGHMDWSSIRLANDAIDTLLESVGQHIADGHYQSAYFISAAVMEQIREAINYIEDSSGQLIGNIGIAIDLINDILSEPIPDELRKLILKDCLTAFEKKIYDGWDWHLDILTTASLALNTDDDVELFFEKIEAAPQDNYTMEGAQKLKYQILLKFRGADIAGQFLNQHITNPDLRMAAIKINVDKKDFDKAISIAQDGINHDRLNKPGLVVRWQKCLFEIAQAQKDTGKIIEYARLLFMHNFRDSADYYKLLKQHVKREVWPTFLERLILDIRSIKSRLRIDMLAFIYIREQSWDRLLSVVKEQPSLDTIELYEKYLAKDYSHDLATMYADAIIKFMVDNVSRTHYIEVAKFIRKMMKLGAKDKANEVVAYLRKEYPRRKALMEELDNV